MNKVLFWIVFCISLSCACFAKGVDVQIEQHAYVPTYMLKQYDFFEVVECNPSVKSRYIKDGQAYIPKGIKFKVKLLEDINSKKWRKGRLVKIAAAESVMLDGKVVIAKDAEGTAFLVKSRKAAGLGRKGKLEIAGNEIITVNNVIVPLTNGIRLKGQTDGGAGAVAVLSFVGGMFMKGSNVELPEGYVFDVVVREDVDLGCTLNDWKNGKFNVKKENVVNIVLP